MFQLFIKPSWRPCKVPRVEGRYGSAHIVFQNLECEVNGRTGKLRFRGDDGHRFHFWLSQRWSECADSALVLFQGSPWTWTVDTFGTSQTTFQVSYSSHHSKGGLFSDTLDAVINALEMYKGDELQ